ncbi:Testican-2 [Dufourea novaeangliae]|uniref:Testican-2 n=1 Tax=Dufourea novaeangliae TaxID=178035 RepID=A0A154PAT4_DUFNO|nr:Testican-2 [Dufourea novaeangliae]
MTPVLQLKIRRIRRMFKEISKRSGSRGQRMTLALRFKKTIERGAEPIENGSKRRKNDEFLWIMGELVGPKLIPANLRGSKPASATVDETGSYWPQQNGSGMGSNKATVSPSWNGRQGQEYLPGDVGNGGSSPVSRFRIYANTGHELYDPEAGEGSTRTLSSTELQEEGTVSAGGHFHSRLRVEEGASQVRGHSDPKVPGGSNAFFDSEDDDEDQDESKCQECPVVKPTFLCGSDNRTYSSPCRLEYHNCIHHTSVRIACKGFCSCKAADLRAHNKKMQTQRQKSMGKLTRNRDITLTPRDFNYDNHHYQYLKYTKRAKALAAGNKYDDKHLMSNEIMEKTPSPLKSTYNSQSSRNTDCPPSSKPAMANRLLDWFSVVMSDSKHRRPHPKPKAHHQPIGCQSEVRWMFGHLDSDNDGHLSLSELYGLEHDQNEPCLKPFLDGCDTDGDIFVNGPEWCGCFSKAERPCAAVHKRSSPDVAPACDSRGYYRSTQCHRGLGLCWCVDPHGVEFAGTRTRGSKPDCDTIVNKISNGGLKTNSVDLDDDEDGGTDSAQDLEGSADQPLDF